MKISRTARLFLTLFIFICISLSLCSCEIECPHTSVEQTVTPPTCDDIGKTHNLCKLCGEEFDTDIVLPLGHALSTVTVAPTCDAVGYDRNSCSVCGVEYSSGYIKPVGHELTVTVVEPTCDKEGFSAASCETCDFAYTYEIKAPIGHNFATTATRVTSARQNGSTLYTCGCGFSYVGDYVFYSDIFKGAYVDTADVLCKGVDTSYHNHSKRADETYLPLDWATIKSSGYDFAILRAGYMGVKDAVFEMDYADARAAGLELGAYFYSYADSVEEAREEALFCLELLGGKQFEYPIFFDIEDTRLELLGKDTLTDICVEFISTLQENGYYAALYTNNTWLTTLLQTDKVTTLFDVWYARYPSISGVVTEAVWNTEKYGKQMAMWQFSQTGVIEGIVKSNGDPIYFDLNYAYKDYTTLIKELGYNGFKKQ